VLVYRGSPGVSLDGKTQDDTYSVLLEVGGQGGLTIKADGIASDFLENWESSKPAKMADVVEAPQALLLHSEGVNLAFYGKGTSKALKTAMEGQKELLQKARVALAAAKV
jgi:hypothetical protein